MAIEVNIRQPNAGSSRVLRFSRSPVRLGRNELNDIPLQDPFVSEWHGIIRFDERQIAYFDLGSTNGSILDGKRLAKSVAAPLSESSRLKLGLLEVSVVRRPGEPAGEGGGREDASSPKTLSWGVTTPASTAGGLRGSDSSGGISIGTRSSSGAGAGTALGAPTPAPPGARSGSEWSGGFAARSGADSAAGIPGSASGTIPAPEPPPAAPRQAKLLETFCEAFVGLRKGYEQFGAEVGVRTLSGATPMHRAATGRELLGYLMQPNNDVTAVARELIGIFADLGIHHVALMEGITEGVRGVLKSLDPRANDLDASGRLWTASKTKNQWKSYVERFDQMLSDDSELHAAIFGDKFARGYAAVAQGDARGPRFGDDS